MSFHEKSAWACLLCLLLVFLPYFGVAFLAPAQLAYVPALIGAVVLLVVLLALVHILFAVSSASIRKRGDAPPPDEREVAIELRAAKASAIVLGLVVLSWCLAAYAGIPLAQIRQQAAIADAGDSAPELLPPGFSLLQANEALFFVHLLFAGFVLANLVYYASMVFGYRRSV